ncbi:MAG: DUF5320 family protein [Candidatus Thorarchaeota archaeon SMTZ1-83]
MSYGYGRGGGRGRGLWPGNGPFRNLPPWQRPGWLYGPGSCWTLGYWRGVDLPPVTGQQTIPPFVGPQVPLTDNRQVLENQRAILESQLKALQETLERIEKKLSQLEE